MKALAIALAVFVFAATGLVQAQDRMGDIQIINRNGVPHSLEIDRDRRIIRVFPDVVPDTQDIFTVPPGSTATTQLAAGPWKVYGDDEMRFTVMVQQGGTFDFTLQPFLQTGPYGQTGYGLLGLVDDGYNQSSYQLFSLETAPQVVVVEPPPPDPIVVVPSPSYYYPPPYHRDKGRELGEAIGSAVFDILGEVLSDDHRGPRRRHR